MRHFTLLCTLLALLAATATAAAQPDKPKLPEKKVPNPKPPAPAERHWTGPVIVFTINGVGDSTVLSDNLRQVAAADHLPLVVREIRWCRKSIAVCDYADRERQQMVAAQLADTVQQWRAHYPDRRIVFAAHSSGTNIAVLAAEMLPPRSVDRIVLLASTLSPLYDLRPALRATRGGIDAFFSANDNVLSNAEDSLRTSDGRQGAMAGRVGFRYPCDAKDCAEYANLRQRAWQEKDCGLGGHYVWCWPLLLRRHVVPVILEPPSWTAVVPATRPGPAKRS